MNTPTTRVLGRKPRRDDPRTLALATYATALPAPPKSVDWLTAVPAWPMYANDHIGDCTIAAAAHLIQAWTEYALGADTEVTDADVVAAYSAVSGYDPATGDNDNGAVELDVLNFWRRTGIGGHKITAYVKINHRNTTEVRQAIHLFGGVYIGARLPLAAQDQIGHLWQPTTGPGSRAGSWGGHAVNVSAYDPKTLTCITWGQPQPMTWSWWRRYVDEAYAIVTVDQLNKTGTSPDGLNTAQLLADLQQVAS